MATTDLPYDYRTGDPRYELEEPMERLQTMLNQKNVDIESLDIRGEGFDNQRHIFQGFESKELQIITGFVDGNPEQTIRSGAVRDLNDKFDKTLDNSDPNYIFRDDLRTRNNVGTIQTGNASFAKARDMLVTPPPIDVQQKIFDLLRG